MLKNLLDRSNLLLILFASGFLWSISCKQAKKKDEISLSKNDVYYTCSMHLQVKEENPGKCPICQMDLIAVPKSSMKTSTEVKLSKEQISLGNIQVDTIGMGNIGDRMVL